MSQTMLPESRTPRPRRETAAAGPTALRFYRRVLRELSAAGIEFLVGGGYALERYLGIGRLVKDLDLFLRAADVQKALDHLGGRLGCDTELTFPHWLGKARKRGDHVDLIFNAGNGVCVVDDEWFDYAVPSRVLDVPVLLCPVEEMIWSKAFVMERERYDGADVAHLLHACAGSLDWVRLSQRFGKHWRILFAHLTLFGFIYPSERRRIPEAVMRECVRLLDHEMRHASSRRICRGTLTSRAQYLVDLELWGYEDARLAPHGSMSEEDASIWTAAIDAQASRPLGERPREADAPNDLPVGRTTDGSM
ncbi:MAG: nucleotidyltransferase [Candidatus Rokuibacteriota bacterium]